MNSIIEWLIYLLTLLSVQPEQVPLAEARAAGAVCVAYASLQRDAIADDEEEDAVVHPPIIITPDPVEVEPEPEPEPAPINCPDGKCNLPSTTRVYRWRR